MTLSKIEFKIVQSGLSIFFHLFSFFLLLSTSLLGEGFVDNFLPSFFVYRVSGWGPQMPSVFVQVNLEQEGHRQNAQECVENRGGCMFFFEKNVRLWEVLSCAWAQFRKSMIIIIYTNLEWVRMMRETWKVESWGSTCKVSRLCRTSCPGTRSSMRWADCNLLSNQCEDVESDHVWVNLIIREVDDKLCEMLRRSRTSRGARLSGIAQTLL